MHSLTLPTLVPLLIACASILTLNNPSLRSHQARSGLVDKEGKGRLGEEHCQCGEVVSLVFCVHGIGQGHYGHIHHSAAKVRETIGKIGATGRLGAKLQEGVQRVQVLPLEWRSTLTLDAGTVDAITPLGIEQVRGMQNSVLLDVLYFTSPRYCQELVDSLTHELNRVHALFMARNPGFAGSVDIMAHSLGSIISFDILANQERAVVEDPMVARDAKQQTLARLRARVAELESMGEGEVGVGEGEEEGQGEVGEGEEVGERRGSAARTEVLHLNADLNVQYKRINFRVDRLFCLGSPVALFLSLRGASADAESPHHGPHLLPRAVRTYNIFHQMDPIAYRLEPLIFSKDKAPETPAAVPRFAASTMAQVRKAASSFMSAVRRSLGGAAAEGAAASASAAAAAAASEADAPIDDGERLDFALPMDTLSLQYLQMLSAHTSYWDNEDVVYFIFRRVVQGGSRS